MADMKWKVGYGAKDDVAPAIEEQTLDSGDFIITSDTEEMGFVKPDGTAMYIKSRPEIFISLSAAQEYIGSGAGTVYAGQIIVAKLEDEKYHTYTVQPSDGGYVLEEIGNTSNLKQYVIIGTRPLSGQEEGIIYIDNNIGYIWNGSDWVKVFEDVSADLDSKAPLASPSFTGTVTIDGDTVATQEYVNGLIGQIEGGVPGIVDDSENPLPSTDYKAGQMWRVAAQGTYVGEQCEIGDLIICLKDYASGTASNADFMIVQANIDGAVTGANSSTDGHIVVFNGATGKVIKDSNVTIASLNDAIAKAHEHTNKTQLDTYTMTQTELLSEVDSKIATNETDVLGQVDSKISAKIGTIPEGTTVKEYVDNAIGSGGTDSAEAIAQAKAEAIQESKAYTDTMLTITEF